MSTSSLVSHVDACDSPEAYLECSFPSDQRLSKDSSLEQAGTDPCSWQGLKCDKCMSKFLHWVQTIVSQLHLRLNGFLGTWAREPRDIVFAWQRWWKVCLDSWGRVKNAANNPLRSIGRRCYSNKGRIDNKLVKRLSFHISKIKAGRRR